MEYAIEVDGLTKTYGSVRALEDLALRVRRGEIYGFLGLNGAGKTTTIRLFLGMIRPDSGSIRLMDQPVGPNGFGPWAVVGHLAGSPSAYSHLTVSENLEIARRLHGIRDPGAVSRVVALLGLAEYADRKAGALSTGNLQRLALARALLHEPALLVLDEPTSGLDPAGVVEIRDHLRSLSREHGVAIFMSSHILTEVDRLATRIGIIHHGRLVEELDGERMESLRSPRLLVRARNLDLARAALVAAGFEPRLVESQLVIDSARATNAPDEIASLLVAAGASPTRLAVEQEDLESHFLRLTGMLP